MKFIVIFGPPAVGKMSVGDEITQLTGIPVFHNHLSIEPVLRFFPFGSDQFRRVVDGFRANLLKEIAASDLPGVIFTFVWDLQLDADKQFLEGLCEVFETVQAEITFVELKAELDVRLVRNKTEKRLSAKASKRDVAFSERLLLKHDQEYQMNSDGNIPLPYRHIVIENSHRSAEDVAKEIVALLSANQDSGV